MAKKTDNVSVSFGISGMNRQNFEHLQDDKSFTFARNANIETDDQGIGLTNERSNLLCSQFKPGYVVIGYKYDPLNYKVYFFLTQKDLQTKVDSNNQPILDSNGEEQQVRKSEIGFIKFNTQISSIEDIEIECGCNFKIELLELDTTIPYCNYETIVSDDCNNCLNFDPNYPIFDIVLKQEACGFTMTFTDGLNPPRYIILNQLNHYTYTGDINCGIDETIPTCLDCEKLRIFPRYIIPCLTPKAIQFGGRLKRGKYEFAIAYCDKLGSELSPYFHLTYPISIFDLNNIKLDQPNLADVTNLGIRLDVSNLDKRFNYYKIAVIQNADINGIISSYIEGIHNITDNVILYTSDIDKERISLNRIFAEKPIYKTWGGLTAANNYLFGYDYTTEKEWNLQPVVNLMGSLLRWQTVEAEEDLYSNGINDSLYSSYMRDEVYPIGIRFWTSEGYVTSVFPFINRPPNQTEITEVINTSNDDVESILAGIGKCNKTDRKYHWQYYNSASVIGECTVSTGTNGTPIIREITEQCFQENIDTIPAGSITLSLEDDFTNLKSWVEEHNADICNIASPYYNLQLCTYLSNTYPTEICPVDFVDNNIFPFPICSTGTCSTGTCETPQLIDSGVTIGSVTNEVSTQTPKLISEYVHNQPPKSCANYEQGQDDNNRKRDTSISGLYVPDTAVVYYRDSTFITNLTCDEYESINSQSQFFNYKGAALLSSLVTTYTSTCVNTVFNNTIHKEARWYQIDFSGSDKKILEVTKNNSTCLSDYITGDGSLRYTIYNTCTTLNTPISCGIFNVSTGLFVELTRSDYTSDKIIIVFDCPIIYNTWNDINMIPHSSYTITPPCGCVDMILRDLEYKSVVISYDSITLDKVMTYKSNCHFLIPELSGCDPVPHKYGKFAFWQSEVEYPDNTQIYDSSTLKITAQDLSGLDSGLKAEFEEYYVDDNSGIYTWKKHWDNSGKDATNFICQPIRHFKFPDNRIIPFMDTVPSVEFSSNRIYPIGITIDTEVITTFLQIAVKNNLITQEQKDSITDFEIFRGDRSIHKSVIMKGIVNDMYKDDYDSKDNQVTFFRNFPYNTLGDNAFLCSDKSRNTLIKHPFNSEKNNRFSLIAPEVYYNRPTPPTEVSIEGYMFGNSIGGFKPVEGHSEWVILGRRAIDLAGILAGLEVAFEIVMNIATATIQGAEAYRTELLVVASSSGVTTETSTNVKGAIATTIALGAIAGINTISNLIFNYSKYRTQWLQTFEDLGNTHNFADLHISQKGWYNSFTPNTDIENQLRGLVAAKYLKPGVPMFTEGLNNAQKAVRINNRDREDSLYISFGDNYFLNYPQKYKNWDNYSIAKNNSSRYISLEVGCDGKTNNIRRIASPYFSLKNYVPNQYGQIDSVKWLSINHCGKLTDHNQCKTIFGGDIKISRVDFKNKVPFFSVNAMNIANRIPFDYNRYPNIGIPKYYCSYKSEDKTSGILDIPYISTEYNFDCLNQGFYVRPPSKIYLFSYGVPHFLVESDINCNYRYAGKEPHEQFASSGIDVEHWVQEKHTSIAFNNIFYYNQVYSKQQTGLPYRILTGVYDKEFWDCLADSKNGVVWSSQDNSEVSLNDPWLIFKPYDVFQLPTNYGRLISLENIESQQILARFSNNATIFNAVDVLRDRITTETEATGTGGMFAKRPIQFNFTNFADTGSSHKAFVSCEFGHFWCNASIGKIYQTAPNGQSLTSISDYKQGGGESGMRKWFRKYLPFKILKQGISNLTDQDIDNTFKGLGIVMWWDYRFKRLFVTKRDYIVQKAQKDKITFTGGNFYTLDGTLIELSNPVYFKDISWTASYSPLYQSWISYHDFKVDYALAYTEYFQTGLNYSLDPTETGIWSHLLTNRSFQIFNGKKYPFEIEIPIKNNYVNNILKDIKIWTISKRYHNEEDYAVWLNKSFNKAVIYNQTNNSGLLELHYEKSHQKSQYPKLITPIQQAIPVTHYDEMVGINYFYNRVKNQENHLPIWNWDDNEINKTLNSKAINFTSKRVLERLRGDWFLVHLYSDNSTDFQHYFKWMVSKEDPYN